MLQIYLPIAEVTINVATLLFVSVVVGFFAGLLGIGGGFLLTPILIFLGIPPIYAVANGANNILAASVSGTIGHWFKDQLDIKMGILIILVVSWEQFLVFFYLNIFYCREVLIKLFPSCIVFCYLELDLNAD